MSRTTFGRLTVASLLAAGLALPLSGASASSPTSGAVIRTWNGLALDAVRHGSASDAQAARLYAMVNAAMYDAVNGLAAKREQHTTALAAPDAKAHGDARVAAASAAHDVLVALYPADSAAYDTQLAADIALAGSPGSAANGKEWGAAVAAEVLRLRADDGSSPARSQTFTGGIGAYTGTFSGVQFTDLAPFAIADSDAHMGAGPPALSSAAYATALNEVKAVGDASVSDAAALATYRYWSLGGRTGQPPGAWVQVAQTLSESADLSLADTARLLTLTTLSMVDTVAPTYATKVDYGFWRPMAAIREAADDGNPDTAAVPGWSPRAGSPGTSPEHWSGHSSFSAAGASAIAGFFCTDDIGFTLATDSGGGEQRSYPSLSAAAAEAGRSRVVGGIHFEFSNQAGLAAGRAVATEVLSRALLPVGSDAEGVCTGI